MKSLVKKTSALLIVGGFVACSPKQFTKEQDASSCQSSGQSCVTQNGKDYFDSTTTVAGGKVDILIVDDNSASMSFEQANLGTRFSNFIQNLDNKQIDYRIGVVTTDISSASNPPRAANQNGALQDGKLIAFSDGSKFLTPSSGNLSQKEAAFKAVIQRPETSACEQYITSNVAQCRAAGVPDSSCISSANYTAGYNQVCPSGDERGIYAARLVVENNPNGFMRAEADLAVIILSDEDVRGQLYTSGGSYALEDKDKSLSFVNFMASTYPSKKYAGHAIIVPSGDSACLATQNSQTMGVVGGSTGVEYEWLRYRTNGTQGSICSTDYTSLLQNIFNNVSGNLVDRVSLACASPGDLTVTIGNNSDPSISWVVQGNVVVFNKKLNAGTNVRVAYSCPSK